MKNLKQKELNLSTNDIEFLLKHLKDVEEPSEKLKEAVQYAEYRSSLNDAHKLLTWYDKNVENIGNYFNPVLGKEFEYDAHKTILNKVLNSYEIYKKKNGYLMGYHAPDFKYFLEICITDYALTHLMSLKTA